MKKNRGITLIALVITIVVLVVLVAVSINVAFGNNGIFQKAKEAASTTADQIDYESNRLPELMQAYINENVGNTVGDSNSAPSDFSVTLTSKETNSITVTAKATDLDGEDLSYTLYTKIEDGTYEAKNTSDATASGTEVTLTATGLAQYTTYNYYVAVSDGKKTINSEVASVRTYCPTTICTGPFESTAKCTNSNCSNGRVISRILCPNSGLPGKYMAYAYLGVTSSKCINCGATFATNPGNSDYPYKAYVVFTQCPYSKCNHALAYNWSVNGLKDGFFCSISCVKAYPKYGTDGVNMGQHTYSVSSTCGVCGGDGLIDVTPNCSHGKSATHYYCEHGDDYTTEVHD